MFTFAQFDEMSGPGQDIDIVNPAMVSRLHTLAASLSRYEIAARLADASTAAADAARARRWQEEAYGEASPDAIVDDEYHEEQLAAWTLIAAEHSITIP